MPRDRALPFLVVGFDTYDKLPPEIRALYSKQAYAFLSDDEKAAIVEEACEPDYVEDGRE